MSEPTPMTHAEIVDVLLTAKVRCSTFPMSGLTAAERDAEHARIDRAIAALREETKPVKCCICGDKATREQRTKHETTWLPFCQRCGWTSGVPYERPLP